VVPSGVIRRRVIARGRVQGVFFRDTARRMAVSRAVSGWARNRDDGAVEAVFEGEPAVVETMLQFCRKGPARAHVAEVEVIDEPPEGLEGFRIG